ncbi:hypothetical protein E4O03_11590 [Treponema sp. OMZ 792]|uniref:hypothetical protein n=1 Tax=unclassified Treponema TaxID=2638727 RepID=UPI0020A37CA6|nr:MULTISPECIES: hypothetical protein [unclassified Treponema]UTC74822.1 hypothetical protein E4O03_11590 [Treponema sp. OMZ 792]UTC76834.1 hypothetical protein E4O04_01900 [Treponema sp. OMZ 799]UTC81216.1 hypothetical protein E4O07_11500 [Treponema sp. OMZ 798]
MKKTFIKSLTGRYKTKILTHHIDLTVKAIQVSIEETRSSVPLPKKEDKNEKELISTD